MSPSVGNHSSTTGRERCRSARKLIVYVPAIDELAIGSSLRLLVPVSEDEGVGLTSYELEGLGLDGLIGVRLRNSTHFDEV